MDRSDALHEPMLASTEAGRLAAICVGRGSKGFGHYAQRPGFGRYADANAAPGRERMRERIAPIVWEGSAAGGHHREGLHSFAFSFARPQSKRDWRSFGAFSAFLVALFTEMYGFPLTIYVLSGWLQTKFPEIDFLSHDAGHLLEVFFGWRASPHWGPFHILSTAFIGGGFWLLARSWTVLYGAQRAHRLALTGPYARIRHPQYVGFVLIMFGFLLQWPTILTLAMFPVLMAMYGYLAMREEADMNAQFGKAYRDYAVSTPRFIPGVRGGVATQG